MLATTGDSAGARAAFEIAATGPDPLQAALARVHLLLRRERDLPPGVFSTPFPEDLEPFKDLAADSPEWRRVREERLGHLRRTGSQLASAAGQPRDRAGQLRLFADLIETAERITGLANTPEHAEVAGIYRAAIPVGDVPDTGPEHWSMGMYALRRLAEFHLTSGAVDEAREWYQRVYSEAVRLAETRRATVVGPVNAGRGCRKLADLGGTSGTGSETQLAWLEQAVEWTALACKRQPADVDCLIEHCLNLRRLGEIDTERTHHLAADIIDNLTPLDAEGKLSPTAANTLAWAHDIAAHRD